MKVTSDAVQVYGGYGFIEDHRAPQPEPIVA
jgi:alkylation response protein AidB-like acyl-CoA dehydrogenase